MDYRLIIRQEEGVYLDAGYDTSIDGVAPVAGDLLMSSAVGPHGVTQVEALRVLRRVFCAGRYPALVVERVEALPDGFVEVMGYVEPVAVG